MPSYWVRRLPVSLPTVSLALPPQYWAELLNRLFLAIAWAYPLTAGFMLAAALIISKVLIRS
jgi:hypothetical protein